MRWNRRLAVNCFLPNRQTFKREVSLAFHFPLSFSPTARGKLFFPFSLFTFFSSKSTRVTLATLRRVPVFSLSQRAQKGNENKLETFTMLLLEQLDQRREEEVLRPRNELAVGVGMFLDFDLVLGAVAVVLLDFRHQVRRGRVLGAFLRRRCLRVVC